MEADALARLTVVRGSEYTYDGDPETLLLGVEAERIRIAYQFQKDELPSKRLTRITIKGNVPLESWNDVLGPSFTHISGRFGFRPSPPNE